MRFLLLLSLLACLGNWAAASLTIIIPPSTLLPNPHLLPASTQATLTTRDHVQSASLTRSSTLVFHDLPSTSGRPESYLLDIRAGEWVFAPYRVDVAADGAVLGVWETFRGNAWDNRGPEKYVVDVAGGQKKQTDVVVEAKVVGRKGFYEERAKCERSLWKEPSGPWGIIHTNWWNNSLAPKLGQESYDLAGHRGTGHHPGHAQASGKQYVFLSYPRRGSIVVSDHCTVDPEMRAEFEQHSRASPISGATNNAMAGGGFDLAGWMAGTSPGPMANADAAPQGVTGRDTSAAARRRG